MRKQIHSLILCGLLGLLVYGCSSSHSGDKSVFESSSDTGTSGNNQTVISGTLLWHAAIYNSEGLIILAKNITTLQIISSPAIATDGTIYVGSTDGCLYALKNDGAIKWRYQTGDQIVASPVIGSDGTIYVGSADRQLYAINPNGSLKWVYPTKSVFTTSAALGTDGTIYIGGTNLDKTFISQLMSEVYQEACELV